MQGILKELALGVASLGITAVVAMVKIGLSYAKEWIIVKTNKAVYENALCVAKGMYYVLEEQYNSPKNGAQKRNAMNQRLLKLFPSLTPDELDSINKQVCNEIKSAINILEVQEDDK